MLGCPLPCKKREAFIVALEEGREEGRALIDRARACRSRCSGGGTSDNFPGKALPSWMRNLKSEYGERRWEKEANSSLIRKE
jgi:hypothetical protein